MELDLTGLLGLKNEPKEPRNATVQASRTERNHRTNSNRTFTDGSRRTPARTRTG